MLTISAPIEVKAKSTYIRDPEAFYHRIKGNYSLMETHIGEEDLLHIAATPPEIYIQEGEGITSIFSRAERNETNISKVNILNNVLNRIITSADVNLTYQDRVFITDALYKLGVRDDRRFMKAFYKVVEETQNTNTLINLYLERGGELRELIDEIRTSSSTVRTSESSEKETSRTDSFSETVRERLSTDRIREIVSNFEKTGEVNELQVDQEFNETNFSGADITVRQESTANEETNYLYSSIMRRLNTGAVYQIVSNFNKTVEANEVDAREFSIADQSYIAQKVLLSVLRQRVGVGSTDLTFLNENIYEQSIENEENLTSSVRNELTSAVLMDMVRNLFHTAFDRIYTNNETFYRFEDTFFKASDQTFLRLVGGYDTELVTRSEYTENFEEESSRLVQSEIELLETTKTGEVTWDEVQRLTDTINAINIQNENRRMEYVRLREQLREREQISEPQSGILQTREDAALALTDPKRLMEKLEERKVRRQQRRSQILTELRNIIPDESMEIYQLLEQYYQGDTNVVNQNIVRPAQVGELIYDVETAGVVTEPESSAAVPRDPRTEEFLQAIKREREGEASPARKRQKGMSPVETVHRYSSSLTTEELNEQLSEMETNLQKQINKTVQTTTVTENHVINHTDVETTNTRQVSLSARDVEQLVENEVKSKMNSLTGQVMNKIERQMRNEKMRRGY
ncbi:MAG: hypothetical protein E7307_07940 [Butyrivibrio sp.]|nr:hypothetical protein [Butyrivibrio sp.]